MKQETDGTKGQAGVTPATAATGTPTATVTREEHEKAIEKAKLDARSAVLADVGRQKKAADDAMKVAQAAQERLARFEKEREQAELESARDDPSKLTALQERQRRRQLEAELDQAKSELNAHKEKLAEYQGKEAESVRLTVAQEVATRLNVDPAKVTSLAKFTDGSPEAIEAIARELPRLDGKQTPSFKADSNANIGGGSTWEQVRAAYIKNPYDPAVKARYLEMKTQRVR